MKKKSKHINLDYEALGLISDLYHTQCSLASMSGSFEVDDKTKKQIDKIHNFVKTLKCAHKA